MGDKTFNLTWNNHLANLSGLFEGLYKSGALTDTTLACQGGSLRAHRLVLAACSPFFERVFKEHYGDQPILILKSVTVEEMECLLDFMYRGSIDVSEDHLGSLIKTATDLEIRGLSGDCGSDIRSPYTRTQKGSENRRHSGEYQKENLTFQSNQSSRLNLLNAQIKMEEIEVEDDPMVMDSHESSFEQTLLSTEENKSTPTLYNRETRYKGQKRVAVGRPVRSSQDQSRSESSDLKELNFNGSITDPTVPAIQMNEDEPDQDENVCREEGEVGYTDQRVHVLCSMDSSKRWHRCVNCYRINRSKGMSTHEAQCRTKKVSTYCTGCLNSRNRPTILCSHCFTALHENNN